MVPELRYQSAVIGAVALAVVTQEAKRQVGPRRNWNVVLSVEALTLAFGQRFSGGYRGSGYEVRQPSDRHSTFYRFRRPAPRNCRSGRRVVST